MIAKVLHLGVIAVCLAGAGRASAGTISGKTVDLSGTPLVGVTIQAFAVNATGQFVPAVVKSETSKAGGLYSIDVGATQNVVLRFFDPARSEVFLPSPPNGAQGGAISGLKDVKDLDVVIPALPTPVVPMVCYQPVYYYYPQPPACRRLHWFHR